MGDSSASKPATNSLQRPSNPTQPPKKCCLGLIDYLSHNKTPLSMFKQNPLSSSKLICKLTGDTINKSEEHIWKHINGKRFLHKLEKEEEKLMSEKKEIEEETGKHISEVRNSDEKDSHSEEPDFWVPPVGSRWDFDDGGDRWAAGSGSKEDDNDEDAANEDEDGKESLELSKRQDKVDVHRSQSQQLCVKKEEEQAKFDTVMLEAKKFNK
ncbi:Surfeit locus protein 2 [Dillenia turbinata]|uniref:Surfeit locus protein 2 n=1 Tax=Dillenia turbinata TaxID=194707 RepID=A0AAN8VED2_9MAGN